MKNFAKIILAGITTIILGAIGSGLWEKLFSRLWNVFAAFVINTISNFVSTYKDSIYSSAAAGFHEDPSLDTHNILMMILPIMYYIAILEHPAYRDDKFDRNVRSFISSKKGFWVSVFLTFLVSVTFGLRQIRATYENRVITYSQRSLKIIAPYVSDMELKQITSQFYLIKDRQDFLGFNDRLNKDAQSAKIILPKFDPL